MTDDRHRRAEELRREAAEHRQAMLDQLERQAAISAAATSSKGLLTVEVGAQGEIRSLVFHSRSYRQMAPAELADVIVRTVEVARRQVLEQVLATLPATVLGDVAVADLVTGEADLSRLLTDLLPDGPDEPADPVVDPDVAPPGSHPTDPGIHRLHDTSRADGRRLR